MACALQFYGVNEGTPIFFGNKDKGKFGTYWVKDGKVRAPPVLQPQNLFRLCHVTGVSAGSYKLCSKLLGVFGVEMFCCCRCTTRISVCICTCSSQHGLFA